MGLLARFARAGRILEIRTLGGYSTLWLWCAKEPQSPNRPAQGVRRTLEIIVTDQRVSATVVQTVGSKGHDGFAVALRV